MKVGIKIKDAEFANPVLTASGTFGYGEEYSQVYDINSLGGIITKGLTLNPCEGNSGLRILETPCGMINRIGLQNVGVDAFIREKTPFLNKLKTKVIANIAGFSIRDFADIITRLDDQGALCGYEINVSCPNVEKGGIEFSSDKGLFKELLQDIRKRTNKLLIIKLSPLSNPHDLAVLAEENNMDAVTVANTYKSAIISISGKKLKIKGGFSGPAVFPVTLNLVLEIRKRIKLPIIASGGIYNADTAIQYLLAGASALQIGAYNFVDPKAPLKVIGGIKKYLKENKISDINDIIGTVKI